MLLSDSFFLCLIMDSCSFPFSGFFPLSLMGSNSTGKDLEGATSAVNMIVDNYEYQQEMNPDGLLDQFPPHGSRPYEPPSPLLIQQVPAVAMQIPEVVAQPQPLVQHGYVESVIHETFKTVRITWNHAGTNVAIVGSWDDWRITEPLHRVGQSFAIVKTLPIGIYNYCFNVDGHLTHAPEFPWDRHDSVYAYNILDLRDYMIPQSEDPPSPPSSYDNKFFNEDDFKKLPPELPPQILETVTDDTSSITHLELNHLYLPETDGHQFNELRSTRRFQHKYVTTVRYKSGRRER